MQRKRTDYKVCPLCGASLDVGEKCDCIEQEQTRIKPALKCRKAIQEYKMRFNGSYGVKA